MLYDQAILAKAYVEAYQVTRNENYARVARETFDYVLRDLRDPKGGFLSAEDADSEGEEGKFYVWLPGELKTILGAEAAAAFGAYYEVTSAGNFERATSILHVTRSATAVSKELGLAPDALENILATGRAKLLEVRGKRIRPHLDDKVLTDWNGLMISAFAYGGAVLGEPRYIEAAERAASFVLGTLGRDGRLLHRWRDEEAAGPGFLDDYTFFGMGLFDLYQATLEPRWLAESIRLSRETIRLFWDETDGAMTLVGVDGERLIIPTKEIYDGAIPSGNSVGAAWFLRMGQLIKDADIQAKGRGILSAFSIDVKRYPAGFPYFLMALDFSVGPTREIVISGERLEAATKAMLEAVRRRFLPDAVVALKEPGENGRALESLVPFAKEQRMLDGKAAAYVCRNYACERPTADLKRFEELLDAGINPPTGK